MRTAGRILILVLVWLLAWGDFSVANLISGAAVAVVLLVAFPPERPVDNDAQLHPIGMLRLAGYVARQLVMSNIVMAKQIIRPPRPTRAGVLAHHLDHPTDEVVTVISSVIALSPGTMVVDVAPDSSWIYVHFFHIEDLDAARRELAHLEQLAIGAITPRELRPVPSRPEEAP